MFYTEEKPKQEKRSVSYGGYEKQKLFDMESALMDHYGYNYSQLVKTLIRKNYYELKAVLQSGIERYRRSNHRGYAYGNEGL